MQITSELACRIFNLILAHTEGAQKYICISLRLGKNVNCNDILPSICAPEIANNLAASFLRVHYTKLHMPDESFEAEAKPPITCL